MKYRVFTENGDILFYGEKSANRPTFTNGNSIAFVASPAQHVELTRHLNRHASNWNFTDKRNFHEGLVIYDLPPYFKVEAVPDNENENDAAVGVKLANPAHDRMCACNAGSAGKTYSGPRAHRTVCPDQPFFPADHTADPYTEIIDVNYAYEGERFRAEVTKNGRKTVRYGTFAMDGNAISPNYGWLTFEAEGSEGTAAAKIRAYGPDSGKQYINVRYDDRPAGYYNQKTGPQAFRPNEGLEPDTAGLKIYGLPEINKRKTQTIAASRKARAEREANERVEKARRELAAAEKALRTLA